LVHDLFGKPVPTFPDLAFLSFHKEAGLLCIGENRIAEFHRIREAMKDMKAGPIGGSGKIVEADETYFGKLETPHVSKQRRGMPYKSPAKGPRGKRAIVSLVERGGEVRTFHVDHATAANVRDVQCATSLARALCTPTLDSWNDQ
jgi:hypothetical protein